MERRRMVSKCPVCSEPMHVTRLACTSCGSALEGRFTPCRFCQLTVEQQQFIEVFITSRGNIREMERILGVSYPTVRGRLDAVIEALGYSVERDKEESTDSAKRRSILESLEKGELTVQDAIKRMKE